MSLFPSSFESSSAGPSNSTLSSKHSKNTKRKRPSTGAHHDEQLLKSTQANLEKLMSRLDKGDLKEKAGTENMGVSGKKRKANNERNQERFDTPKGEKKNRAGSAHNSAKKDMPTPRMDKQSPKKSKKNNDNQHPKSNKKAPVELPLPTLAKSEGKINVGGEGNLTDLQKNMQSKLEGARFRWINEQLYSTPSTEAVEMMKKDPKIFADYHMTHRILTAGWPSPPLDHIIKALSPSPQGTVIADLGCGDAGLARALVPQGKVVLSYDLVGDSGVPGSDEKLTQQSSEGWVIQADFLEQIPLPGRPGGSEHSSPSASQGKKDRKGKRNGKSSEIVDVAVCCLSLMGKNWVGGIAEVCRVLKQGGTFHVAEVTSRFTSTEAFVEKVESFGFKLQEEDSPSTHFTLFRFTKESEVPLGPARGQQGWEERVAEGEDILQACVYKKR
ncbi:uncharacterized protein IL334_004688 [Kwoniella shivajii]|uniref:Ribosomal RNA-processing protein 8 n=1 Tax=Kwoniella shivajii TaxID=564305 RepID=A0ABZ1D418_9TREE|nr:hypothetical protein IL334_004688 [Kwoniella shivajii]